MKKNLMPHLHMLIVAFCSLFFVSCEKDKPSQSITEMAIGEYELVDVHWEGLPMDLDNDGVAQYALLHEYKNLLGYFETNHIATIGYKKSTGIKVEAQIAFPEYIEKNGDFQIRGLKYIPMSIGLENIDSPSSYQTIRFKNYDDSETNLSDIYSVTALNFTDNSFKLKLHCTLLHVDISDKSQNLETNYLIYTYRKKK
ncbi:MAG: hypothetical protein SOX26_05375 [Phocaeicola sp.]|nr:hypothetical protein [Phocaeicola sp.]